MASKSYEELILRKVYNESLFDNLIVSEKPDFILINGTQRYGVELIEHFTNEASARTRRPSYVKKVANNEWVHKADIDVLESVDTWVVNVDGSEQFTGRAVKSLNPTWQEKIHNINKIVIKKNKLFNTYEAELDYIDLLIYDQGDLRKGTDTCELFAYLYARVVADDLFSPYRNVTLVIVDNCCVTNTFLLKQ